MSDKINLLRLVSSLDIAPQFSDYSKVRIIVSDDTAVEAGDDTGRTLEVTNPFGTQAMAQKMLNSLRGYQYQPYYAKGALLDPAAEIGDGITIKNTYGGLYQRERDFGRLMKADIAAPHDEEIDHEYKYESPTERKFTRQIGDVRASLLIQAGLIEAKVSKTSPTGQTSFSWAMNDTSHTWYANGNQVMKVSASGLEVNGKVTATSGFIGNGSSGFAISAKAIYNGMTSLSDTTHNGIYIGTDGIALGKGAFKVTSGGNVTANNLTANNAVLTGTLKIGGTNITAAALRSGAQSAYTNSGTWSTGAGYGYNWANAKSGFGYADDVYAKNFHSSDTSYFSTVSTYALLYYPTGARYSPITITVNGTNYHVFGYVG